MLTEGSDAPGFSLPGVVDGTIREVDVGDSLGENIVVIVFYPADFNPACDEDGTDLTELDLFTMQRDVDIYAVSTDSVYSHRAFAASYSLDIPLLSDVGGEVVADYGVGLPEADGMLAKRAVFVLDQDGVVQYTWATEDLEERPDSDAIREAVSSVGGDSTAVGRYRVGHAHYVEGRRAFTSAMDAYEGQDWLISQGDFERAMAEFQEAADQFQSAVRFAESGPLEDGFERAQEKATALWQAADWLADSANAYASGDGQTADEYREDAETPLETARDIGEPPDPDAIDLDAAQTAGEATAAGDADATDLQAPADPAEDDTDTTPGTGQPDSDGADIDAALEGVEDGEPADTDDSGDRLPSDASTDDDGAADDEGIDDEDLETVTAELEAENEAADDLDPLELEGDESGDADPGARETTGTDAEPADDARADDGPGPASDPGTAVTIVVPGIEPLPDEERRYAEEPTETADEETAGAGTD